MNNLTVSSPNAALLDGVTNKDVLHRLTTFKNWLDDNGTHWLRADLSEYLSYLSTTYTTSRGTPLAGSSLHNYISTVRRRYAALAKSNKLRDDLFAVAPGKSFVEQKAFVDETIERIRNNAAPDNTRVNVTIKMHKPDSEDIRLTFDQSKQFVVSWGTDNLLGKRNTAVLALLIGTGIRIDELCQLQVSDLNETYKGHPCLLIRHGKRDKQRVVIYAPEFDMFYSLVQAYLEAANISSGWLFRPFKSRHGTVLANGRLQVRTAQDIVEQAPFYPRLHAHRTRHTYARIMHKEFNYPVDYVREQLGHDDISLTQQYIGNGDDIRLTWKPEHLTTHRLRGARP